MEKFSRLWDLGLKESPLTTWTDVLERRKAKWRMIVVAKRGKVSLFRFRELLKQMKMSVVKTKQWINFLTDGRLVGLASYNRTENSEEIQIVFTSCGAYEVNCKSSYQGHSSCQLKIYCNRQYRSKYGLGVFCILKSVMMRYKLSGYLNPRKKWISEQSSELLGGPILKITVSWSVAAKYIIG